MDGEAWVIGSRDTERREERKRVEGGAESASLSFVEIGWQGGVRLAWLVHFVPLSKPRDEAVLAVMRTATCAAAGYGCERGRVGIGTRRNAWLGIQSSYTRERALR